MRAGGPPGASGKGDDGLVVHPLTPRYFQNRVVPVQGQVAVAVVDGHQVSVPLVGPGVVDGSRADGIDGRAGGDGDVVAPVIHHFSAAERVQTPADPGGYPPVVHGRGAIRRGRGGEKQYEKDEKH